MSINYTAFTIKSKEGLFREIKIPMTVSTSSEDCEVFNKDSRSGEVLALWDTGATQSGITKRLAKLLGLTPRGMTEVITAGGVCTDVNIYSINFNLAVQSKLEYRDGVSVDVENDFTFFNVLVTELPDNGSFDFLVGMDVITHGDFSITNRGGCSCISFRIPPDDLHTIDYVKKLRLKSKNNKNREKRNRKKK